MASIRLALVGDVVEDHGVLVENGVAHESWGPFAEGKNNLFSNDVLQKIGDAHGKSIAQVVLRWLIQRDVIVIPKSVKRERMAQNLDIFDFELSSEQMDQIATLEQGGSQFFDHHDVEMVKWLNGRRER